MVFRQYSGVPRSRGAGLIRRIAGESNCRSTLIAIAAAIALVCGAPVFAHHSNSMYDRDHQKSLKATITAFEMINPHIRILFDAKDAQGHIQQWVAEGPNTIQMTENGWKKETLKAGDRVTIVGNLAKNGTPSIRLRWVTLPNDKDLFAYTN